MLKTGSAFIDMSLPGARRRQEAFAAYICFLFTATIQDS